MFDATKAKFRGIDFKQVNTDDSASEGEKTKYGVSGIPHIVMLDGAGKILYSQSGAFSDEESFAERINSFK